MKDFHLRQQLELYINQILRDFLKIPNKTKQPTGIDNWPPSRLIQCVLLLFILSFVGNFPTFFPCQLPSNSNSEYISPLRYLSFQRVVPLLWLLLHLKIQQTEKNGLLLRKSQDRSEVFTPDTSHKRNRPDSTSISSGFTSTCLTYNSHTPKAEKGRKLQTCCSCKT